MTIGYTLGAFTTSKLVGLQGLKLTLNLGISLCLISASAVRETFSMIGSALGATIAPGVASADIILLTFVTLDQQY